MPYTPSSSSRRREDRGPATLPASFTPIRDVLDEKVSAGSLINIVGLVKDCRAPIPTSGTDYKMALTLYDISTEEDGAEGVVLNIFRPEAEMPEVNSSDVVLLHSIKVQNYRGFSLISHRQSDILVYACEAIPKPPRTAEPALKAPRRKVLKQVTKREHEYVAVLYHRIDKDILPDQETFQALKAQSVNVSKHKPKFCLLKDVRAGEFHDLLVRVVKDPYDFGNQLTLWVTDYTENNAFFDHIEGGHGSSGFDSDPYGYTTKYTNTSSEWPGPFGKRCMQISCFEPHATYVREHVQAGLWIFLWNVQTNFGHNGANLEGFLREDRYAGYKKVQVEVLDPTGDRENVDHRLIEGLQRKRDYERAMKQVTQDLQANSHGGSGKSKRKAEDDGGQPPKKPNAKQRRKAEREQKYQQEMEESKTEDELLDTNAQIRCEHENQEISLVSEMLEPTFWETTIEGEPVRLQLPFTNANYRAHVRVIDYHPKKLEDFAVSRKVVEYDYLGDDDKSASSDSTDDQDDIIGDGTLEAYRGKRKWEWRFALCLEEAHPRATAPKSSKSNDKGKGKRKKRSEEAAPSHVWVVVDNETAQLLTNLDACDLRRNEDTLVQLRGKLFTLWGDLEEKKLLAAAASAPASAPPLQTRQPGDMPSLDSDEEEEDKGHAGRNEAAPSPPSESSQVRNMPFTVCLRQFGLKVRTDAVGEMDAGEGRKWERMFGLFGVKITG